MSVLIKGMEMPKSCEECPLCCDEAFGSYKCYRVKGWGDDNSRAYDCPIVEVPTPHGDLIDSDDVIDEINRVTFVSQYDYNTAYNIVEQADAVIKAEE